MVNDAALCSDVERYLAGSFPVLSAAALASSGKAARGGGSEDFAYVSQEVPALMLALAAGEPEKGYPYPQHHPKVKFDESVLPVGAAVFAQTATKWLEEHQ